MPTASSKRCHRGRAPSSSAWLGTQMHLVRTGLAHVQHAQLCHSSVQAAAQTEVGSRRVRVVTFDLDDTLWPTTGVVLGANADLQKWLATHYPDMPCESAKLQAAMKDIRRENNENIPGYIVSYGQLRESAIFRLAIEAYEESTAKTIAAEGIRVWLQARQDNADKLLFHDAVSTLRTLKEEGYLIGAITNGNGDPREVESLAPFFNFYVSAEQNDVSLPKPDSAPFEVAVQRALPLLKSEIVDIGQEWVHVGDCIENDVQAAKRAGMRTVFYVPPEDSDYPSWRTLREAAGKDDSAAMAILSTKEESGPPPAPVSGVQDETEDKASDLAVDAQIEELSQLIGVLDNWNR